MKLKKKRDDDSRPLNLVLLAASFIIFGVFGLIFLTQMEMQPGWAWEDIRDQYPIYLTSLKGEDLNGDGIREIVSYADIQGTDTLDRYPTNQYGAVYCLDGFDGELLWDSIYTEPVRNLFPIMDVDNDGIKDYFINRMPVSPNWTQRNGHYGPDFYKNLCNNLIINGSDGEDLPVPGIGVFNYTNFYIHDIVALSQGFDAFDNKEDLIVIEAEMYDHYNPYDDRWDIQYACNISSYLINGTKTNSIPAFNDTIWEHSTFPSLEFFEYNGQSHVLYLDNEQLVLFNISASNFFDPILDVTLATTIEEYLIIEDLNSDGTSELITIDWGGNVTLLNGSNFLELYKFSIPPELNEANLEIIHDPDDGIALFLLKVNYWYGSDLPQDLVFQIYSIDLSSHELIWEESRSGFDYEFKVFVLNEDLSGDSIDEIIIFERIDTLLGINEVRRFIVKNFITNEDLAILNTEFHSDTIITIDDFDADGKKDYALSGDDRIIALSSRKEAPLFLSPLFPFGFPLFIILIVLLVLGILIAAIWGKKLSYQRKNIKKHKLTVYINALAIAMISLFFTLFLMLMNIFNNTLISGSNNTNIVTTLVLVIVVWYGALPLTAAVYNRLAPQFAFIFIKLRDLFFKVSKSYHHDIVVLDMENRKETGLIIQVKRLLLPLLLSIAVGFYAYNALTPILGLPQTFEVFGSTEFFDFMRGYMLCCVLPMILSFLLFAFFISGNFLLDDAGVVYFRQNKKYRQPGDIEPISIWAQSIIKGIAGLSALITFSSFLMTVDFTGFFGETGEPFWLIFGFLVVFVMFGGIPFLTSFSYVLLAGEIMEINFDNNKSKLYNLMEKDGYDITPKKITNLYPEGLEGEKDKNNTNYQ